MNNNKKIRKQLQNGDWPYAELSKTAKEHGGPDQLIKDIENSTRCTDIAIAGGITIGLISILTIIYGIKNRKNLKEIMGTLQYYIVHKDELPAPETDTVDVDCEESESVSDDE
jgi:hypothetical protein|nr:MAG TPA: hypothetical protein [Caudoviricetes sp.]